ncbi:MAG: hypothetical protein CMQ24_08600 [Gammaproteobacteria bacterium]|nr:hypothetical protein [Gammaproteobacteria bacterium]
MRALAAIGLAASVLISGCATMSESECLTADWRAIGYEDGSAGRPATQLGTRRQACAEFGVTPNAEAWTAGREEGLLNFCVPSNGFRIGRAGQTYSGVCPGQLEANFMYGFREGRVIGDAEREVRSSERAVSSAKRELEGIDDKIKALDVDGALMDETMTLEERKDVLEAMRKLEARRGELGAEIDTMTRAAATAQTRLEVLLDESDFL